MPKKALVLNIVAHQSYIRHIDGENVSKNAILFNAISDTYLPLLNMFANLEAEGIPFKVNMVMTPTLCSLLSDPVVQEQYIEWLDSTIKLGEAEVARLPDGSAEKALAEKCLKQAQSNKTNFQETFNQDIISSIVYYVKHGYIELMATAATYAFFPHYADIPEAIQAQIETGLRIHKQYFGLAPEGFWLPYMAYTPGLENIIRSYGFNYTILEKQGLLFAEPKPECGVFSPVRCKNALAIFARETDGMEKVIANGVYRNQEKDIGFEAEESYLTENFNDWNVRVPTGYRYWNQTSQESAFYDEEAASAQVRKDAEEFIAVQADKLSKAACLCPEKDVSIVCSFDAAMFGGSWHEGIMWLEQVIRQIDAQDAIELCTCSDLLDKQFQLQQIVPFTSVSGETGYGEGFLDSSNAWMLRYSRKATERMIDLAARFSDDTGLKARSLNLAAKEVLLAQSGDWADMIHEGLHPDYAEYRFKESISAFSTIYDSLGSNSISTEWLTRMEKEHQLFPNMNYHVFSTKK